MHIRYLSYLVYPKYSNNNGTARFIVAFRETFLHAALAAYNAAVAFKMPLNAFNSPTLLRACMQMHLCQLALRIELQIKVIHYARSSAAGAYRHTHKHIHTVVARK